VPTLTSPGFATTGRSIGDLVADEGSAAMEHALALRAPAALTRDLSDAVHALCALHGAAPSMVEITLDARGAQDIRAWLYETAVAFDDERHLLVKLTAAIGPLPSTPGQSETEAAIATQQRALTTLARSDRNGCALGATFAFLIDWRAIRAVLAVAANRAGVTLRETMLPSAEDIAPIADRLASEPACARAMMFGAQQLIAQHRGLWHLLAARAEARNAL
jgi:hypothetical protein